MRATPVPIIRIIGRRPVGHGVQASAANFAQITFGKRPEEIA